MANLKMYTAKPGASRKIVLCINEICSYGKLHTTCGAANKTTKHNVFLITLLAKTSTRVHTHSILLLLDFEE